MRIPKYQSQKDEKLKNTQDFTSARPSGMGVGSGSLSSSVPQSRSPGSQFNNRIDNRIFAVPPWSCVRKNECKSKGEKKGSHKRHCNIS